MIRIRNVRASDRREFFNAAQNGFVERTSRITPRVWRYITVFLIGIAVTFLLLYYKTAIGSLVAVIVGLMMLGMSLELERARRSLTSTEFMNALFASTVGHGYQFCAIATVAGDIAYTDRSFQLIFPDFAQRPIRRFDALCSLAKLEDTPAQQLKKLVTGSQEGAIDVKLEDELGIQRHVTIAVDPIPRPLGFVMLRAK